MHLFYIPRCTIQNRNVHISVLNGVLWDMEQVHYGIYENGLFHEVRCLNWSQGLVVIDTRCTLLCMNLISKGW